MRENTPEAMPSPGESFSANMAEQGAKYVLLGEAMQDATTTMAELVTLADACGLRLQVGLSAPGGAGS